MVNDVLILHENTELLPYVDSYELSPGNNDPTEGIMLCTCRFTCHQQTCMGGDIYG